MSELQDLFEQSNPIPKGITRCGDHYAQTEYMLIDPYASNYAARFKGFMEDVKHQQAIIDNLKAQLNNMETCYIEKKKECEELQKRIDAGLEKICQFGKEGCLFPEWLTWAEKALRGES